MTSRKLQTTPYTVELTIDSQSQHLPILIRKHAGARRMVIRYQPLQHAVSVTLPRYVSVKQGLRFVEEKRRWLERYVNEHARHIPLADGQIIPVLGQNYTLTHIGGRGVVTLESDRILVPGDKEFMSRRVIEWLKRRAKEEIARLAHLHAANIGHKIKRIGVRDTSSHWGSCSHDGNLSFSWRLIFAPYNVFEYVVCHEVAHLAQQNHSPAFWALVAKLYPEHHKARAWLRTYGSGLYAYN